jgi:hypothetical protein
MSGLVRKKHLMKRTRSGVVVQFSIPSDQLRTVDKAARFLDVTRSQLIRRSLKGYISVYTPELIDPTVSVIEPWQVNQKCPAKR